MLRSLVGSEMCIRDRRSAGTVYTRTNVPYGAPAPGKGVQVQEGGTRGTRSCSSGGGTAWWGYMLLLPWRGYDREGVQFPIRAPGIDLHRLSEKSPQLMPWLKFFLELTHSAKATLDINPSASHPGVMGLHSLRWLAVQRRLKNAVLPSRCKSIRPY